jgi:hypothetical protein
MARMFWTQKQDIGPSGREVHRMTYDSNRQRVVLFGDERVRPLCSTYLGMGWGILDADERPRSTSPKRPHIGFRQHSATHSIMLLAGCDGSLLGNSNAGPDPGGGFYCAHNAYEGCVNP